MSFYTNENHDTSTLNFSDYYKSILNNVFTKEKDKPAPAKMLKDVDTKLDLTTYKRIEKTARILKKISERVFTKEETLKRLSYQMKKSKKNIEKDIDLLLLLTDPWLSMTKLNGVEYIKVSKNITLSSVLIHLHSMICDL